MKKSKKNKSSRSFLLVSFLLLSVLSLVVVRKIQDSQTYRDPRVIGSSSSVAIPRRYRTLYQSLDSSLTSYQQFLDTLPNQASSAVFGAELSGANTHRGEDLLTEQAYQGNVLYLNALERLGVGGVSISLQYPMLLSDYPRSAEYWNFYQRLATEIKRRGSRVFMDINPAFVGDDYSNLHVNYQGLTVDEYLDGKKEIAVRVATELQPDYLSIADEVETEQTNVGFSISQSQYEQFIRDVHNEIGNVPVQLGAGSGTWENESYVSGFAQMPEVDYIDIHIYPLTNGVVSYLDKASEFAQIAQNNGKRVIVAESWLYKASVDDLIAGELPSEIFSRDPYSFWIPLDKKMMEVVVSFAKKYDVTYASPFWSQYMFGYLDYAWRYEFMSYPNLQAAATQKAVENILRNRTSETGTFYSSLISE